MAVNSDDVALVRRTFDRFNQEYEAFSTGGVEDYFRRFFTPDAVVEPVDGFPVPGRYEGLEGYREWLEDAYGGYRDVSWELDHVAPEGDYVLVLGTIRGREVDTNVELEVQLGLTYELRDGRISRLRVYVGHERAEAAARGG